MRYYLIADHEGRPFVMAETPDRVFAVDELAGQFDGRIVRADGKMEGTITLEIADAIAAWKAGDDDAYTEWFVQQQTEVALAEVGGDY